MNTLSRRSLLATAAVAPFAIATASASAMPTDSLVPAWDNAFALVQREQARDGAINALFEQHKAAGTLTGAFEQEWSDSVEPLIDAEWSLFDTPAPDLKALEWKLTMLSTRGLAFEDEIASTLIADVRRLDGREG